MHKFRLVDERSVFEDHLGRSLLIDPFSDSAARASRERARQAVAKKRTDIFIGVRQKTRRANGEKNGQNC
jgi:hypothetical protein